MSSPIQISEDDDSFSSTDIPNANDKDDGDDAAILLTSDEDSECQIPPLNLNAKKSAVIKKLFPCAASKASKSTKPRPASKTQLPVSPNVSTAEPKKSVIEMPIAGLKVSLPLKPYGSQVALMFKVC